jgi:hypothetical protein
VQIVVRYGLIEPAKGAGSMMGASVRKFSRGILSAVCGVALIAAGAGPSAGADASSVKVINGVTVEAPAWAEIRTSAELDRLIQFNPQRLPVTATMDVVTGQVIQVSVGSSGVQPLTTVKNYCNTGDVCLLPSSTPLANYGFSGVGDVSGTWSSRRGFKTGSWHARMTWIEGGEYVTGVGIAPNVTILFSSIVTVRKVEVRASAIV